MEFDDLLDRLWIYDFEVFAHDWLLVAVNYRTDEEVVFHNSSRDDVNSWLVKNDVILCGYNNHSYDRYILQGIMVGCNPEEVKEINDKIVKEGIKGYEIGLQKVYMTPQWDLYKEINPPKSLKELEGNMNMDITETTIPFDLPDKWNEQQYKEVLYYCEHDVRATKAVFDRLIDKYKSKFIVAKLGQLDPVKALSLTNANLSALFLNATPGNFTDYYDYKYPDIVDKSKIPQEFLDYIDDLVEHNDKDYKPDGPKLDINGIIFKVGVGGGHGFTKQGLINYDRGDMNDIKCD